MSNGAVSAAVKLGFADDLDDGQMNVDDVRFDRKGAGGWLKSRPSMD